MPLLFEMKAPLAEYNPPALEKRLAGFVCYLRTSGFRVGLEEHVASQRIANVVGVFNERGLRNGLRSLMCSNYEEWVRFDELFEHYWRPSFSAGYRESSFNRSKRTLSPLRRLSEASPYAANSISSILEPSEGRDNIHYGEAAHGSASRSSASTKRDISLISDDEQMLLLQQAAERLALRMKRRIVRRTSPGKRGRRIDFRRTFRNSLQYDGEPIDIVLRCNSLRRPNLLIIIDVSRSMSLYSTLFLRFARGILQAFTGAEAFICHTRLMRITEALRYRSIYRAKTTLALLSSGWTGGTRLGESMLYFNKKYRRLLTSRTVVVIMSDGLDTGEPSLLGEQIRRMRRACSKIVWLSPLLGRKGYEPITGSLSAALPHVDLFASAYNLEGLMSLESVLIRL